MKPYFIESISSPNFNRRRNNALLRLIVVHITASTSDRGTILWFQNPESKVSAHYLICRRQARRVIQFVDEDKRAWHVGKAYWKDRRGKEFRDLNSISMGIECTATLKNHLLPHQYKTLAALCANLCRRYALDPTDVVGHRDVIWPRGRKQCPGPVDWVKLRGEIVRNMVLQS